MPATQYLQALRSDGTPLVGGMFTTNPDARLAASPGITAGASTYYYPSIFPERAPYEEHEGWTHVTRKRRSKLQMQ